MPTLLATSPLAATRSKPGHDGGHLAAGDQAGGGGVDEQLVVEPEPRALPHGQPRALQQRARLAGEHGHRPAVRELGDHAEAGPAAGGGERAGVAVGHHRDRPVGQHRLQRVGAVARERRAGGLVLAVDLLGGLAGGVGHPVGRGERRGRHPLDRPAEVARGRPRARHQRGGALQRLRRLVARELHRQPVGGGDADQRRAAHREPLDRLDRVRRPVQLEHDLLGREPRLVEDPQGRAGPVQRRRRFRASPCRHRAGC